MLAMIYSRDSLTSSLVARSHCIANSTCSANTITLPPANSSGRAPAPARARARASTTPHTRVIPAYTARYYAVLKIISDTCARGRPRPTTMRKTRRDAPRFAIEKHHREASKRSESTWPRSACSAPAPAPSLRPLRAAPRLASSLDRRLVVRTYVRTLRRGDWRKKRRARRKRERPKGIRVRGGGRNASERAKNARGYQTREKVRAIESETHDAALASRRAAVCTLHPREEDGKTENRGGRTRLDGKGRRMNIKERKRRGAERARKDKDREEGRGKGERERGTHGRGVKPQSRDGEQDARQSLALKDQQVTWYIACTCRERERERERESLVFENVCQGRCPRARAHYRAKSIVI